MTIELRRAADRFVTRAEGRLTWHSFSFGAHYDPDNIAFGPLVAHNVEQLPPGTGYPDHRHHDVEIVTLVLDGALRHTDSSGRSGVLVPGEISRTSAGSGIVHAEIAASDETTRFVQTWLRPDEPGGASSYASSTIGAPGQLTEVIGPDGAIGVGTAGARLYLGHLDPGTIDLPDAPLLHLFTSEGRVLLGDCALGPEDAARLTDEGGRRLTVETPGLLLVWSLTR